MIYDLQITEINKQHFLVWFYFTHDFDFYFSMMLLMF